MFNMQHKLNYSLLRTVGQQSNKQVEIEIEIVNSYETE